MSDTITQQSPSIAKLLPALIRARGEFPALVKDSQNPHFKSMYADLAAVLDACDRPLGKHDLAILQVPVWDGGALVLHTTLCHTSGEWVRSIYPVSCDVARPQVTGAGMTYARRYTYMAMAGIAPEDDDGNTASAPAPEARYSRPAPPPARDGNGNGHTNGHNGNGNGHTKPATATAPPPAPAPAPAPAATPPPDRPGAGVPVTGGSLWRWAAGIERERGPGLVRYLENLGSRLGWGTRVTAWTPAQVEDAYNEAVGAMERIYNPDVDETGDYEDDGPAQFNPREY